jgi:hypothetical protein
MNLPDRFFTLARTLRHLRPSQIAWRLVHVVRLQAHNRVPALGALCVRPDAAARGAALPVLDIAGVDPRPAELWRQGFVEYHGIRAARDDWRGEGQSRLWRYQRHYHAELVPLALANVDEARSLVDDWIAHNPPCRGDAWEPYPVARRLLNWCMASAIAPTLRDTWAPWLAVQMRFVASHLERHLLGNHLLCDLCAVIAAAASLDTVDSEAVGARAARMIERALERQVLPDGGYAERTAQYHVVVLHDALLALALHRARGRELDVGPTLARMLRWADWVRRADGSYPWLNDASPDGLPTPPTLRALSNIAEVTPVQSQPPPIVELPDTGWTIFRDEKCELLFEHGLIGPDHQPGHGHADALSFELVWNGVPVVTDTGVTTYAPGNVRAFERSAAAHATVQVNGRGADEPWASFRVGGRARPVYLGKSSPWRGAWLLCGQATSYEGWLHRRRLLFWPGHVLVVGDEVVRTRTSANIISILPLAPEWNVVASTDGYRIQSEGQELEVVVLQGKLIEAVLGEYPDRPGWVADGFGRGRGRFSLSLSPAQDGRLLYALVAPGVRVSESTGDLTIAAGDHSQRLAVEELLP